MKCCCVENCVRKSMNENSEEDANNNIDNTANESTSTGSVKLIVDNDNSNNNEKYVLL